MVDDITVVIQVLCQIIIVEIYSGIFYCALHYIAQCPWRDEQGERILTLAHKLMTV